MLEDAVGGYTFAAADFGFQDPSDNPANTLQSVLIVSIPSAGTFTSGGNFVLPGTEVSLATINGGGLKFTPTTNANGTDYARFTFKVRDNGGTANGGVDLDPTARTMSINVTPVNDAPVGITKTVTINEDNNYTFGATDFASANLNAFDPSDTSPPSSIGPNSLQQITITSLPASGTLLHNGSPAAVNDIVTIGELSGNQLVFQPAANANGTTYAQFGFKVKDTGGTANNGVDTDPTAKTITVNVTAVPDNPFAADKTIPLSEDASYNFTAADFGFVDTNDASPPSSVAPNTFSRLKITSLPSTGTLTVGGNAVNAGDFITVANIPNLRFTPAGNSSGTPLTSFSFQVEDNAASNNLSVTPNSITFNVTSVNDAPLGTTAQRTTNEDITLTLSPADFGFSDPNDSPANGFIGVKLTTLPANGTMFLNNVAVTPGQIIPIDPATLTVIGGPLTFQPAGNANGLPYARFTFQVQDNGGTAGGGVDLDPLPKTLTINVQPVNDKPLAADRTTSAIINTTISITDFGFSDPNDASPPSSIAANTIQNVIVQTAPSVGTLLNGTTPIAAFPASVPAANLRYVAPASAGTATFTFTVQDNGGTANLGVDTSSPVNTLTINISTGPHHAPVGANSVATAQEDVASPIHATDVQFSDPNEAPNPADSLAGIFVVTLPSLGSLTYNGSAVTPGLFIPASDMTAGNFRFLGTPNASATPFTSFTFRVKDTGGTALGGSDTEAPTVSHVMTINVQPVNDPSIGVSFQKTTLEDNTLALAANDFPINDPNDNPANALAAVQIVTLPAAAAGTLFLAAGASNPGNVTAGQFISSADLAFLRFTPALNANSTATTPLATFTFKVQDDGGTANGGIDLDPTAKTASIYVTPVNDPPTGSNSATTLLEDHAYTFTLADFASTNSSVFDPNDTNPPSSVQPNTLLAVKITTLPTGGTLTLGATTVNAGAVIQASAISGGQLKFTPTANANGSPYSSLTFQVQDNGGTANGGADLDPTPKTVTLSVTPVNDQLVGTNVTVNTGEDVAYTFHTTDFPITDPLDNPANTLASITILSLPGAGTLRLNGSPVVANQIVAASDIAGGNLQFTPDANQFGLNYANFIFRVQDNGGTANGGVDTAANANTVTVNVGSVNDAPRGADKTFTLLEDGRVTLQQSDFGYSDPNDTNPTNAFIAVKITSLPLPAAGSLTLNNNPVSVNDLIAVSDIIAGRLVFAPVANTNGSPDGSFTFQVKDDGGTVAGGIDLSSGNAFTFNVTPVNDAPTSADRSNANGNPIVMVTNSTYTFTPTDFPFSDPSDTIPPSSVSPNTLQNVKIDSLPLGNLRLSGTPVTVGQLISIDQIINHQLTYTPPLGGFGNPNPLASFTFQVQDNGGTANGGANLSVTPNTVELNVNQINGAPVGRDSTVATNEDTGYTFSTGDFASLVPATFDPSNTPPNNLKAVKITTLPTGGTLKDNGAAVSIGQFIPVADITGNKLVFTPSANVNGTPLSTFNFQVQDDGGTGSGGVDLSVTPNTATIVVNAVNDAPVGTPNAVTTSEDTAYTINASDFGFTDPSDTIPPSSVAPNTLSAVIITTLPTSGTLRNGGNPVSIGATIAVSDFTNHLVTFTPAANANGAAASQLTFKVKDGGGTANGGADTDATARALTFNITAVNDPPVGRTSAVTTNEDTDYTFAATDFASATATTFDPTDAPNSNNLRAVKIATLPTNGTLLQVIGANTVAVTVGQVIQAADIATLRFHPAANANGAGYSSFTFQAQDDGGTANGGIDLDPTAKTVTVNVTSVNDAPATADKTQTVVRNTTTTFAATDFPFTDPSDAAAPNNVLTVTILSFNAGTTPAGTLTFSGTPITTPKTITLADFTAGKLQFLAANSFPVSDATFTFQVQDDGGTASGGSDLSAPATYTLKVINVPNNAPAGTDHIGANAAVGLEDAPYVISTADLGFTDPLDNPANNLKAVKVTTLPSGGSLTNRGVNVTQGQFIPVNDITNGLFKFVQTTANLNGSPFTSFTFQVQDDGGIALGGVDLDQSPNTLAINLLSVNDAPTGANFNKAANEDQGITFAAADFTLTDSSDSPANTLNAVKITALPASGTLTLGTSPATPVSVGQFIPAASLSTLVYTPAADQAGTFTVGFQVQDTGGTANGGVDLDPTAKSVTITIARSTTRRSARRTPSTRPSAPRCWKTAAMCSARPTSASPIRMTIPTTSSCQ